MLRPTASLLAVLILGAFVPVGAEEQPREHVMPVRDMVEALTASDALRDRSFYYDPGFKGVGSFAIHNHFAKRVCLGYLVSDGEQVSYRFIRAWPGLGSSNDAFQTEFTNLAKVEYKFYKRSKGIMDAMPERLSVKFYFEDNLEGLISAWKKKDMKFDIWDVAFGYTLMESLKEAGVFVIEKN